MRLYHYPRTRSTRVLWLLEELGSPYDVELLVWEGKESPEHLARHPLGRVPVLEEDGGGFVFESAAICLHLADRHAEAGLLPPTGTLERALVYQWCFFAMGEVEPPLVDALAERNLEAPDEARLATLTERFRAAAQVVEDALAGHEYLVGDAFSVADVVAGGVLGFAKRFDQTGGLPNVNAYVERLEARPARQRANAIGT